MEETSEKDLISSTLKEILEEFFPLDLKSILKNHFDTLQEKYLKTLEDFLKFLELAEIEKKDHFEYLYSWKYREVPDFENNNIIWRKGKYLIRKKFYENGEIRDEYWYFNGKLHREDDEPARIYYDGNGKRILARWYSNGEIYRKDEAAGIVYLKKD